MPGRAPEAVYWVVNIGSIGEWVLLVHVKIETRQMENESSLENPVNIEKGKQLNIV